MKYEIITDSSDMLVLTVNSRVIAVSRDMSAIMYEMWEDYINYRNKVKRTYESALIYPELGKEEIKEDKPEIKEDKELFKGRELPKSTTPLGKMFTV